MSAKAARSQTPARLPARARAGAAGALLVAVLAALLLTVHAAPGARETWRPAGLTGMTVHALALGHHAPSPAFAATEQGVYRRVRGRWRRVLAVPTVWSIVLAPDDRTVVAGDEAGDVLVSGNGGLRWRRTRVTPLGVYAVTLRPHHPRWILAGAGGGIYLSRDGGRSFRRELSLPGSGGAAFAWEPGSARLVFAGAVAGAPGGSGNVFVSRDAGKSWRVFGRDLHSSGGIMSLAFNPAGTLLAGTMGVGVWRARLRAMTWHRDGSGLPRGVVHGAALTVLPGTGGAVFVATLGQGVFQMRDGSQNWVPMSDGLPAVDGERIVLALAYTPSRHTLYAGTASGVWQMATPP